MRFENRGLLILLGVLCVVIVGLGAGIAIANFASPNIITVDDAIDGSQEDISEDNNEADYDESEEPFGLSAEEYISEMEKKINESSSSEEKAEFHSIRAATLYNRQKNGEGNFTGQIFSDAYAAEFLSPTASSAYEIYCYEDEFGDKSKAEEYLDKAKERGMEIDGEIAG